MTEQEIFNTVCEHLLTQNKKSVIESGRCMYRTQDGLKCAIGCLIPDDMYRADMERRTISSLMVLFPRLQDLYGPYSTHNQNLNLMISLQKIHDGEPVKNWAARLEVIGDNYNLQLPEKLKAAL